MFQKIKKPGKKRERKKVRMVFMLFAVGTGFLPPNSAQRCVILMKSVATVNPITTA